MPSSVKSKKRVTPSASPSPSPSSSSRPGKSFLPLPTLPTANDSEGWHRVLNIYSQKVQTEASKSKEETPVKRSLYAEVELLRLNYSESNQTVIDTLHTHTHVAKLTPHERTQFENSASTKEVLAIMERFDTLRAQLAVPLNHNSKESKAVQIAKLILMTVYTLLTVPLFTVAVIFRPLNPFFRKYNLLQNHSLPTDMVQKWYARGYLFLLGVDVLWDGLENINDSSGTICMFSHASNLDPFIVASGPLAYKWIGKKSLFRIPILGWLLTGLGHIPIDRENLEKAKKSLEAAATKIHKYDRSIAISPEGTRSKSGRLVDFKKGAFHTAIAVNKPISPVLIEGAYTILPPKAIMPKRGQVRVTVLPLIELDKKDTYVTLASKVRRRMLEGILRQATEDIISGNSNFLKKGRHYTRNELQIFWMPIMYSALYIIYKLIARLF